MERVTQEMRVLGDTVIAKSELITQLRKEKFCDSVVDLYSNVSKSLLDIIIYAVSLTRTLGAMAPGGIFLYLLLSALLLTRLRRPLGQMTVRQQQFEGEYRYVVIPARCYNNQVGLTPQQSAVSVRLKRIRTWTRWTLPVTSTWTRTRKCQRRQFQKSFR